MLSQKVKNSKMRKNENKLDVNQSNDEDSDEEKKSNDSEVNEEEEDAGSLESEELKVGDYVHMIKGSYVGMCATTISEIGGNKCRIKCFDKKKKWWTLK